MPHSRMPAFTAPPAEVVAALDALRAKYGIPAEFPAEALAEAETAARSWEDGGAERFLASGHDDGIPVRDARDLALVTIDPPGSMDLDQAVLLERVEEGEIRFRVHYAIASLATFVTPGGALDTELRRRGETVYAPDRSTPLHPEALSHGAASLLPDEDRPACLWTIDLDAGGRRRAWRVERALVRSRARLAYVEVQAALDAPAGEPTGLSAAAPSDLPELLREIGTLRQQREAARGGVSLSTPEQETEAVDPADPGAGYRLVSRAPLPVEEWNAQISLLTGICAADVMVEAGVGILRTMPPAEAEDYARLRRVARALDIPWPDAMSYPELVRSLDGDVPADLAFMEQALSLFRGAGYLAFGVGGVGVPEEDVESATEEAVHAAIAARYAHVTAPLRRLVDRYGEEACVAACAGAEVPGWVKTVLPDLPGVMEETGRRARGVARGAVSAVEALVLRGHEGESFEGVITSVREGKGEIMLAEPAVVAIVRGPNGERLPVGERVRAVLESVDVVKGRAEFRIVD